MKIYTKIIYEWLDGKLVEQSSDSFEYKGDLTLCGGGGGGGGTIAQTIDKADDFATDPIGTTTDAISNVGEQVDDAITDPVGTVTDTASDALQTAGDSLSGEIENIATTTTTNLAPVTEAVSSMGTGSGGTLGDIAGGAAYYGNLVTENISAAGDFIGEKAQELSNFINPASGGEIVQLDKKDAFKGAKIKKDKKDLGVNKAKQRARSSLRISK